RHEGRDGHLRSRDRARLRAEDRRRRAARDPAEPARDRGLPRLAGARRSPRRPGGVRVSAPSGGDTLLELEDVHAYYGTIEALKGISLSVREGEIVTLIGANGAGKSTTLRTINGLNKPRTGSIRFAGKDIAGLPAHDVVKLGISQSPEGRRLFGRMTVRENLELGAFQRVDKADIKADLENVFTLFPRLLERQSQKAGTLSGGEQQMVAMGRAMMARPRLLLLDEPSMGLAPIFVDRIFDIIR